MPLHAEAIRRLRHGLPPPVPTYAFAVAVVAVAVLLAFVADELLPHANLSLLFLTGVLIVAARSGLGPSLLASALSLVAYAFFFTPPYHSLGVAADSDAATLAFFLIMAAVTGHLAVRIHREMATNQAALARISKLYEFGRRMSAAADRDDILGALADYLSRSVPGSVVVYVPDGDGRAVPRAHAGPPGSPAQADVARAWEDPAHSAAKDGVWRLLPLRASQGTLGLAALRAGRLDAVQLELAGSLCDQASAALDRVRLSGDVAQARVAAQAARLRSALLSSVSHDLRTPLASIIGSATSLQEYGEAISRENREELLANVVEEATRLDRYIQNLLDMTRLGQGTLSLRRDWVDFHDLVASAVRRLGSSTHGLNVEIRIADDLPLLWVQGVLIEQALVNLLDNAVRFSPAGGTLEIAAREVAGAVEIEVCDEGVGIPPEEREKVFEMFYTMHDPALSDLRGTGLGLAICDGVVAAHRGSIAAFDGRQGRGTCMRVRLPIIEPGQREGEP
jgi:two-component system sensor histidine kinase KdpD